MTTAKRTRQHAQVDVRMRWIAIGISSNILLLNSIRLVCVYSAKASWILIKRGIDVNY